MIYNSPKREIVVGTKYSLKMPDDAATMLQFLTSKPNVKVVHSHATFELPKQKDSLMADLSKRRDITFTEDVVVHLDGGKNMTDCLVDYLVQLHNEFISQKDYSRASQISDKLRLMGIVLMPRKDTAIVWDMGG